MPIMITGGTGFLGSYLAKHLIAEKSETDMVLSDLHPTVSRVSGYTGPDHHSPGGRAGAS